MANQLITFIYLAEALASIPTPISQLATACNLSSMACDALDWLLWEPGLHVAYIQKGSQNTCTHKIK